MLLHRALAVVVAMIAGLAVAAQPAHGDPNAADNQPVVTLPGPSKVRTDPTAGHDPRSVLVRFKPAASAGARERALQARGGRVTGATTGGFVRVTGDDAVALLARLRKDPTVESVTLDYRRRLTATPNDSRYASSQASYLKTVRLDLAWDLGKGAATQVIAVVDTGVLTTHPDLTGRTVAGYNAVTPGAAPTDTDGHGTMVAGIAAANTNNTTGIAGAAWNARIMPVKVFGADGTALDSDVAEGIVWAADHGAHVINLSLGGPEESVVLQDAVRHAVGKGAVVIAAAGNTGDSTPLYPAAYPEVLTVSATDHNGTFTDFSSWGSWVDIAAPGMKITSTYLANGYSVGSGTSYAAPIVSGIAALIRAKYPEWPASEVVARLTSRTRDAGPRGIDPYFGHGIVDAYRVLGGAWAADFPTRVGPGEPNDAPARATALATTATGSIVTEGDVDWYRHDLKAAGTISVAVTPSPYEVNRGQNFDPVLEVYDGGLRLLGRVDTPVLGAAEELTVTVGPGPVYVAVRNYNGALDNRLYTIAVTSTAAALFHPAQATRVGSAPAGVAVGDVTGDGLDDVVLTTTYANDPADDHKVVVFAQQYDGSLADPVRYTPTQPSLAGSLALLDADGDGHTDVALAGPDGVEVLLQDGGALVNGPTVDTAAATQVVASDMDGDGDHDLVAAGGTGIRLLTRGDDGAFAASTVSADTTAEVEAGDVDGDGRADVVGFADGLVRVYHAGDTGFSRTEHDTVRAAGTAVVAIEVADITDDGRADVIAAIGGNMPNSRLNVFRQTETGALAAPVVAATNSTPNAVEAADVDGDGRLDVAIAHAFGGAAVLFQKPDGTLATPTLMPLLAAAPHHVQGLAVSDVDGDSRADLAIAGPRSGLVLLRRAAGPALPGEAALVRDVAPADFATGAALSTVPRVVFTRPVDADSVNPDTVRLVHGRSGRTVATTLAYDAATRTAALTPAAPLQDNTPYRIAVSGVRVGIDLGDGFSSTFVTVDQAPAALASLWLGGGIDSANVTWPEPPITDLDQVIVRMAAGTTAPASPTAGTAVYNGIGETVFVSGLTPGATYTFAAWVRDRSGQLSPAQTGMLIGTSLTGSVSATSITKGKAVTVTGQLRRGGSTTAVAGEPVRLDHRRKGTTEWVPLTTLNTDAAGKVTFSHKPTWTVEYRWRYRGSTTYVGAGGKTLTVTVR